MYARTISSGEFTFGVSGMLWRDNLVMYDRQTDSWWSQADGRAIHGVLKGSVLTAVASDMMTWKQWRALHPETTVLAPQGDGTGIDAYESYHRSVRVGVTGRTRSGGALDGKAQVLGFRLGRGSFAVHMDSLAAAPVLQVEADGRAVVIVSTADRKSGRVFVAGSHVFTDAGVSSDRYQLRDRETGSLWDGFTGVATSGPLEGQRLQAVTAHLSYWFSWHSFFPETTVVGR